MTKPETLKRLKRKSTPRTTISIPVEMQVEPEFMYGCPITGQSYANFNATEKGVTVRRRMHHVEIVFTCGFCEDRHAIRIPFNTTDR
jgi:hypothetical protein